MRLKTRLFTIAFVLSLCLSLALSCQQAAPPPASNGKSATSELAVDMLGKIHTLLLDSKGRVKSRAELSSADGTVTLSTNVGTTLLDRSNKPLSKIQVEINTAMLPLPEKAVIIGDVYNLTPPDATIEPVLKLTLSYDSAELPQGASENDVYIASYDEVNGWSRSYYKKIDTVGHRVTTQIDRLTRYAVLVPITTPAKIGDTVKIRYTGTLDDGTIFDTSVGHEPFEFTLGQGDVIPGFEQAIIGMEVGESIIIHIPTDEAYGPYRDDLIMVIGRDQLPEDVEPEVGQLLQITPIGGNMIVAMVTEVSETTITIDTNHPLAGQNLTFEITLFKIE